MTGLVLPILGIALVDSLNPSALVVTLVLVGQPNAVRRVIAYVAGVFGAYFALGVALMLGVDAVRGSIATTLESPIAYAAQLVIGLALLAYAVLAPNRAAGDERLRVPARGGLIALFALGGLVTVVELGTALPYFGAVALLTAADLPTAEWLTLLAAYNVVFVLPPLAVLGAARLFGSRIEERLQRSRERIRHEARQAFLWILGLIGVLLAADAGAFFLDLR